LQVQQLALSLHIVRIVRGILMGALSLTRRAEGPVENRIIFGSPRSARERYLARAVFRQRRSSNANSLCGQNSAGFLQICRTFKGIICGDVSEFESHMPRQAVRSRSRSAGPHVPARCFWQPRRTRSTRRSTTSSISISFAISLPSPALSACRT
jgi:hypothetical protein